MIEIKQFTNLIIKTMKKILIGILGTAACMAALLVNVSLTDNESSKDTNLVELSIATDAKEPSEYKRI